MDNKTPITVEIVVNAPIEKVWEYWNKPEHITKWAFADDSWEAPYAENDLRTGGKFLTTMAAKDKSASFDFTGFYANVDDQKLIEYDMIPPADEESKEGGQRHVKVVFEGTPDGVKITETFDPENINPIEKQKEGWQAILENFKKYVENN